MASFLDQSKSGILHDKHFMTNNCLAVIKEIQDQVKNIISSKVHI